MFLFLTAILAVIKQNFFAISYYNCFIRECLNQYLDSMFLHKLYYSTNFKSTFIYEMQL